MNHQQSRDNAIEWARKMLKSPFIILDTETTGLDGEAEALTIAVIDRFGNTLLDACCRPTKRSNPKAEATHGISWGQSQKFAPFMCIHSQLEWILNGSPFVVSYCVDKFDARIIKQTCEAHHAPIIDASDRAADMLTIFSEFYGQWNDYHQSYTWKNLSFAASYFGISTAGAHGALADCQMTLGVLRGMAEAKLSSEMQTNQSVECGNCGVYRTVRDGIMEQCPNCGDDETDLDLLNEINVVYEKGFKPEDVGQDSFIEDDDKPIDHYKS